MSFPLVSFIIPAFQQEAFIVQTAQSALDQDNANVEVIVTDDGSTDATFERVSAIRDRRLKVHRQENGGPSAALNASLALAQGDWIAVLGGDDVAEPFRASYQAMLIDRLDTDAVFSPPILIDGSGAKIDDPILSLFLQKPATWRPAHVLRKLVDQGNFLCAPTGFFRRSAFDKVGRYNEALIQLQDYEHALRWTAAGFSLQVSDRPVTRYRRMDGSVSSNREVATGRELEFVFGRMFSFGHPAVWRKAFSDVLSPTLDVDGPLTLLDQVALYLAHPQSLAHECGARRLIEEMQSDNKPLSVRDYMAMMNTRDA